jgi:hypothetical protein
MMQEEKRSKFEFRKVNILEKNVGERKEKDK